MILELLARGEIAVVGLGRSGLAVSRLLIREGAAVYASDASDAPKVRREAEVLRAAGVEAVAGGHDLARIARAVLVVASPGVPPDAAPLAAARSRGVPVVSEVEVALAFLPAAKVIAITGTNGKSTVTALVDHLLRSLGVESVAAGNIGTALSEVALRPTLPAFVALEISSFQLHDTPSLKPAVGVLTNLAPDHLDRYPTLDAYYTDKMLLFRNAGDASVWVTNADDPESLGRVASVPGTHVHFSLTDSGADGCVAEAGRKLRLLGRDLIRRADVRLLGDHNVANVLAAALAVAGAAPANRTDVARVKLAGAISSFRGLPHRLEIVADAGGVQWINDSKATNVASAAVAIAAMARPTIVLLGGRHKGEPYTALTGGLARSAKLVLAYGEAAPLIEQDLGDHVPLVRLGSSFEDVIARARAEARPGDAVLLSPACSSFDMFENYEKRGDAFQRLAAAR